MQSWKAWMQKPSGLIKEEGWRQQGEARVKCNQLKLDYRYG